MTDSIKLADQILAAYPDKRTDAAKLASALREQAREVARKDAALKFYADRDQYERDRDGRMPILEDAGRVAYDALSPTTAQPMEEE